MKKILSLIFVFALTFGQTSYALGVFPERVDTVKILEKKNPEAIASMEALFTTMVNVEAEAKDIPNTYQYIKLRTKKVPEDSELYRTYQKAVYLGLLKQGQIPLNLSGIASEKKFLALMKTVYGNDIEAVLNNSSFTPTQGNLLKYKDLISYANGFLGAKEEYQTRYEIENDPQFPIMNDIYTRLRTSHFDRSKFEGRSLIDGAVIGMTDATGDKYSTYFPPEEAKSFNESLNGDFEGIGAYVEMRKPGELVVTSPVPKSPAEKAWIKGGDRITKIDGFVVTKDTSLQEAVSKIKGPAKTKVTLTIERGGQELSITVERDNIHIDLVTYQKIDSNTSYIQISSFGEGVANAFSGAVDKMRNDQASKLILDLRNNPGGDLGEVSSILDFFVPIGESKLLVRTLESSEAYLSTGKDGFMKDKKMVILINSGTASASEIMAGTIKDYFPNMKTLGEKSYGKGSVQAFLSYTDGSSVKFTTAKWLTGKSLTSIDHIGIMPNVEIKFDVEQFRNGIDNQLEAAKNMTF